VGGAPAQGLGGDTARRRFIGGGHVPRQRLRSQWLPPHVPGHAPGLRDWSVVLDHCG